MVEAVGGSYWCRQAGYWVFGLKIRSKFEWTYLVDRMGDLTRSFDSIRWFIGIRGDPDGKTRRSWAVGWVLIGLVLAPTVGKHLVWVRREIGRLQAIAPIRTVPPYRSLVESCGELTRPPWYLVWGLKGSLVV